MSEAPFLVKTESGAFTLEFIGHPDEASYDAEAGYPGAMREAAHRWHIHRDTIIVFDRIFSPWLEKTSGVARKIDDALTARRRAYSLNPNKVAPLYERFVPYTKRVIAILEKEGKTDLIASIKAEALRVSQTVRINVAPAAGLAPIEPMFFARADSLLEQEPGTLASRISRFQSLVPDHELIRDHEGKPLRESLARLLKRFTEAQMAQDD